MGGVARLLRNGVGPAWAVALLLGLVLAPSAAMAARQIDVSDGMPKTLRVQECLDCSVTVDFRLTNTGVPDDLQAAYMFNPEVLPLRGDTANDVARFNSIVTGFDGACGDFLLPAKACIVRVKLDIRDADPRDVDSPLDDEGVWDLKADVFWGIPRADGSMATGDTTAHATIIVTDQPVPEPGAWLLMLTGLAALGVTARRRREVL
jgi:hypothetical protein